eukprot:Pompholyxophrys_punicea_v1_NODE_450_length_1903_cov_5.312102.p1 type:complete len:357 gc:universal NODE_450_length_1903_cov_5.312102:1121-51(-)
MIGSRTEVATSLVSLAPQIVPIHCIAHREALACKGAAEEIPFFANVFYPTTEHLPRFYAASSTRTSNFRLQQLQQGMEPMQLVKTAFTRWLSHDTVTRTIHLRFIPLLMDLNDAKNSDPQALGLFTVMSSRAYVGGLLLMRDVFPELARLSRIFQDPSCDFSVLKDVLPAVIANIVRQVDNPGIYSLNFENYVSEIEKKTGLSLNNNYESSFSLNRRQYLFALRDHLNSRFPDVELLSSFYKLINPHSYPDSPEMWREYCEPHLLKVLNHYSKLSSPDGKSLIDKQLAMSEWSIVQTWLSQFKGKTLEVEIQTVVKFEKKLQSRKIPVLEIMSNFLSNPTLRDILPTFTLLFSCCV